MGLQFSGRPTIPCVLYKPTFKTLRASALPTRCTKFLQTGVSLIPFLMFRAMSSNAGLESGGHQDNLEPWFTDEGPGVGFDADRLRRYFFKGQLLSNCSGRVEAVCLCHRSRSIKWEFFLPGNHISAPHFCASGARPDGGAAAIKR